MAATALAGDGSGIIADNDWQESTSGETYMVVGAFGCDTYILCALTCICICYYFSTVIIVLHSFDLPQRDIRQEQYLFDQSKSVE